MLPRTAKGYDAFTLVFLTYSALEQYLAITKQRLDDLEAAHRSAQSPALIADFFQNDKGSKLLDSLRKRVNEKLRTKLQNCRDGICCNVGIISAAIRHIFVHGHLAANSNGINPAQVFRSCERLSKFILDFIDNDFYERIRQFAAGKKV